MSFRDILKENGIKTVLAVMFGLIGVVTALFTLDARYAKPSEVAEVEQEAVETFKSVQEMNRIIIVENQIQEQQVQMHQVEALIKFETKEGEPTLAEVEVLRLKKKEIEDLEKEKALMMEQYRKAK